MIAMYPVYHEHFTQKREQATMRAWSGEKCIKNYLVYLDRLARELHEFAESHTRQSMIISTHEQRAFDNTTHCPRCDVQFTSCLLYTSPSPRDLSTSRMPSSA